MVQTHELSNGALLLLDEVNITDTVSIGFWFRHGSRDESEEEIGYSHFLEHMLFKGTQKRTAFQIAQAIDRVGGILNAFTESELTCFFCTLPKGYLELAVDVLTDMIFRSVLDGAEVEKEKSVIMNEILSYNDQPEQLAHEEYLGGLWGDHPLARKITGEVDNILSTDRDRLGLFYRERYTPSNLMIAAAGNFRSRQLLDLLENAMQRLSDGTSPKALDPQRRPPERIPSWKHRKSRSAQIQIYTGMEMGALDLPALYTVQVWSSAVGESMSSRLFQTIREKEALCYSISCFRTLFSDCSLWTVYTSTKPGQVAPVIEALNRELARLHSEPLTSTEVEDAKSFLKGSLILSKENMEIRMKRLVRMQHITGNVMEYEDSLGFIDAVKVGDVCDFVQSAVRSGEFNFLAFGGKRIPGFRDWAFDF